MIYRSVAFLASAVSCGPSPIPVNTQASAATGTYGDVVTYTCIAGYNQSGGGTGRRTCDSSGSWVVDGGDSDPVCSREMQILHSRKIKIKDRLILDIYHPVSRVRHELSRAKHIPSDRKKVCFSSKQKLRSTNKRRKKAVGSSLAKTETRARGFIFFVLIVEYLSVCCLIKGLPPIFAHCFWTFQFKQQQQQKAFCSGCFDLFFGTSQSVLRQIDALFFTV